MSSPDLNEQRVQRYWSRIQRALQILQNAQRYGLEPVGNYQGEAMMSNDHGDWVEFDDVVKAIQILQEGQR